MEIEKIEVLVEKIDQAIKIIQQLKNDNKHFVKEIEDYKKEITKLNAENSKLKEENTSQKNEIKKTNELHQKLEDKIQQILQYLPDEEENENIPNVNNKINDKETINSDEISNEFINEETPLLNEEQNENNNDFFEEETFDEVDEVEEDAENQDEEKDKERLTQLLNEPDKFEKKSLFPSFEDDAINKNNRNKSEPDGKDDNTGNKSAIETLEERYEETLIDEEDDNDIDFHFDDEHGQNDDLPKGVL